MLYEVITSTTCFTKKVHTCCSTHITPSTGTPGVMKLVDTLGFDPVDGGSIDDSWRVQIGTPTTGVNLNAIELKKAISEATVEQNNNYRTAALESLQS